MTISRKLLAILVVLGGWADITITLIGQLGQPVIREDDPISYAVLAIGPFAFLVAGFVFHALIGLFVYKAPAILAVPIAVMMIMSATVALVFWFAVLGIPIQTLSTATYIVLAVAVIIYMVFKKIKVKSY